MKKQWKWIIVVLLAALLVTSVGIMLHVGKMDKIRHENLRKESIEANQQSQETVTEESSEVKSEATAEVTVLEKQKGGVQVSKLRVNHLENPLGYEFETPTFSWVTTAAAETAIEQAAAEVVVFQGTNIVFDSGKQADINSLYYVPDLQLEPYTRYEWQVTVWAKDGSFHTSERAYFETAKLQEPWQAKWITAKLDDDVSPYLRTEFNVEGEIEEARAYVCGLGLYELELNGEKVGDEYLMPGYHSYDQMLEYQTYDITDQIVSGKNAVGAIL